MDEIIEYLNEWAGGVDASELRTFDLHIANFPVRVEVHDRGETGGSTRYSARAFSPDIPVADRVLDSRGEAVGNPEDSIPGALSNVRWSVFQDRVH
jgi:hypothetical protein